MQQKLPQSQCSRLGQYNFFRSVDIKKNPNDTKNSSQTLPKAYGLKPEKPKKSHTALARNVTGILDHTVQSGKSVVVWMLGDIFFDSQVFRIYIHIFSSLNLIYN